MILDKLFESRDLSAKDPALKALIDSWGGETISGANITPENSLRISVWYAGVKILSETIASLPLITYRRTGEQGKERARQHPLYTLLHDAPNEFMTAFEWIEVSQYHLICWGNAFSMIERNRGGQILSLWPLYPNRIRIQIADGRIWYYYQDIYDNNREIQIPSDNMLHLRGLGADGLLGYSPVDLCREALGLAKVEEEYRSRFFKNDARPGAIVEYPRSLSETAYKRFKEDWNDKYSGSSNKFRLGFLEEGLKWHDVGFPPETAQFIEGRKFQVEEIARILGIPLILLQSTEKATSWGCLPGDTLIFTDKGPKPIENIIANDIVWSLGKEGMVRARVIAQQMTGVRKFLTIKTVGRIIRATDNHRMLVRRYQKNQIFGRGHKSLGWQNLWISAGELRIGDYLPIPHGLTGANRDTAPNGRKLTIGIMEFSGLFTGDGNIDGNRIEIAHQINADHISHYEKIINEEFGVAFYRDGRGTRTRFSSIEIRDFLSYGFLGDCYTKRIPDWVFTLKRELQLAYLRGFLDSDGSVQRGRIIYSSVNKNLLEDIRHLCIQVGIPVGLVCVGCKAGQAAIGGKIYKTQIKYQLSLSSLYYNCEIGSNSEAKMLRFVNTKPSRKFRYDCDYDSGIGGSQMRKVTEGWPFPDIKLHKIKSITESKIAIPVYDITVEGTETFIADGVLVHNTGIEQFLIAFARFTIRPWLKRWEGRLNWMLFDRNLFFAEFLAEDLLRADSKTRAEVLQIWRRNGIINADEWRSLENLNPIEGDIGQKYVIEANMTTLDKIGEDNTPEPAPAPAIPMNGNGNGTRPNGDRNL